MHISLNLPTSSHPEQLLLWAEATLLWAMTKLCVSAAVRMGKPRGVLVVGGVASIVGLLLPGLGAQPLASRIVPVAVVVMGVLQNAVLQDEARLRAISAFRLEADLVMSAVTIIGSGLVIEGSALGIPANQGVISVALAAPRIACLCLFASALVFSFSDGGALVLSALRKGGVVVGDPPTLAPTGEGANSSRLGATTFRAGRLIGNCERVLLIAVVVVGKYEALGFLLAAKGFIRSKELEVRDHAEYFILGTFVSMLVAGALGLCLSLEVLPLWNAK